MTDPSHSGSLGSAAAGPRRNIGHGAPASPAGSLGGVRVGRRRSDHVVAASPAMQGVLAQLAEAARSDLPLLISGPPGTGKRFLARAVHAWSGRSDGPLAELAAGGIPEPLQVRELLGARPGAFPALPEAHEGALSRARGGTLVIEDADALGADARRALAEVLRTRRFTPVGGGGERLVEARIVVTAASSEALEGALDGAFHAVAVPPLAERREDVVPLAAHLLAELAGEAGLSPIGLTADARAALEAEPWPGNVAELRERIRGALALAGSGTLDAEALALAAPDAEAIPSFRDAKRAFETRYVEALLRRCNGNISRAARLARKDRKDFYDVIRRTGVDPDRFRGAGAR